jgi:hypothetical protein
MPKAILPEKLSKTAKIISAIKSLISGQVILSVSCHPMVLEQARAVDLSSTKNKDDILDLIYYAPYVQLKYKDEILEGLRMARLTQPDTEVEYRSFYSANTALLN